MTITRTDLTEANGYILEEQGSTVIQDLLANSVIESFARREAMASRTKTVPRFLASAPSIVAEGDEIGAASTTLDEVVLTAKKYAQLMHISEEDLNDSLPDVLTTYKREWASRWARKYDNACLGQEAAADGDDGQPFTSLYRALATYNSASNVTATGGALTFQDISNALGIAESSSKFDASNTIFIAHPKMLAAIRNMEDSAGKLVLPNPIGNTPGTLFGYPLVVSYGAARSTASTDTPTGNPLLFVGNRQMLINGVRGGVESVVSRDAEFARDGVVLKTRIRRGFAVADASAFACVEKN
ncbi:major_cap_HK97, phage major capsid protein, HK97 family [uncultured Caudovirales phage]|uniref:Major_cap_HK97, phage major capsid protein, HK97 family n=1 Tax=uncultured Caudovirales phage TaxID=2100421 RepID=A0A6J5MXK3_9CAUD|nr:major_cap_HK97, phage major capsid protein, HK97 family [uncultured Caudovirales phage]